MVIIYKIYESIMGNRGSKSNGIERSSAAAAADTRKSQSLFVKEQRVDGSWYDVKSYLRCTLPGFERSQLARIPSNHINLSRLFSSNSATLFNTGLIKKSELRQLNP
jgi:hypothetical protein